MSQPSTSASPSDSLRHLRRLVLRLTAVQKTICAVVIVLVALVAYNLLGRLIAFGRQLDYTSLGNFSQQANELLRQYMPILWWALAAIIALIVIHLLYRFACASHQQAQRRIVNADDFSQLSQQLSPEAKEVLAWAWENRRHPVTVGVLQRTIQELGAGRAGKIHLARLQAEALSDAHPATRPLREAPPVHSPRAEPGFSSRD